MEDSDDSTVASLAVGGVVTQREEGQGGELAVTGLSVTSLLLLALCLMATGAMFLLLQPRPARKESQMGARWG